MTPRKLQQLSSFFRDEFLSDSDSSDKFLSDSDSSDKILSDSDSSDEFLSDSDSSDGFLSDSDSSDEFLPYKCDPQFKTKEALEEFMKSCDIKLTDSDDEDLDYTFKVTKNCTCELCGDIYTENYEHICCQQYEKWKCHIKDGENVNCLTKSVTFSQTTNHYAVRNLLLSLNRRNKRCM